MRELLERELRIPLQNFKKGKDKGIDLRYSGSIENEIVIQAKHYTGSQFSNLKSNLQKIEIGKVRKLNPSRYILVTSLGLTPSNTDELKQILAPYIKSTNDIYGKERLNALLGKKENKDIEEKYYKLWLASSNILQRIVHNGIKGRSEFIQEKIVEKVELFVENRSFLVAQKQLDNNKFLIITGDPGVGKTFLAYMLIYRQLAKGYKLICIEEKIKEAEEVLSQSPEEKQIIFFDDFLGSNFREIMNPKNRDTSILYLIERIQKSKNKLLIFTTRTIFYNQALHTSEPLQRSQRSLAEFEVNLTEFSDYQKAKILYNHFYFAKDNLPENFVQSIIEDKKKYYKIIEHENYCPRLIEFFTNPHNLRGISAEGYYAFIMNSLNNPENIWRNAYENQSSADERFLITTLFSFGRAIPQEVLKDAFHYRIEYEIRKNGHILENNTFLNSLKKLKDSFISIDFECIRREYTEGDYIKFEYDEIPKYQLKNPSIADFLIHYLSRSQQERERILHSAIYLEQIFRTFHPRHSGYINLTQDELFKFWEHFRANIKIYKSVNDAYAKEGYSSDLDFI